jgi:hypothetical protein
MADFNDDLSKLPQRERRRLIFQKSAAKYRDLGSPIDSSARFLALIERWIDGELEMREVALVLRTQRDGVPSSNTQALLPSLVEHTMDGSSSFSEVGTLFDTLEQNASLADDLTRVIDDLTVEVSKVNRSPGD